MHRASDQRGWNDDWQVGDLAECIAASWAPSRVDGPKAGDRLRVSALIEGMCNDGVLRSCLGFEGKPPRAAWACQGFRKIRPRIAPADASFTAELRQRLKAGDPATAR